jgi:hypothetical protein
LICRRERRIERRVRGNILLCPILLLTLRLISGDNAELSVSDGLLVYVCKPIDSALQIPESIILPRKRPIPKVKLQQSVLPNVNLRSNGGSGGETLRVWIAMSVSARVSRRDWWVGTAGRAAREAGSESGGTWLFWTEWTREEDEEEVGSVEGSEGRERREVIVSRGGSASSYKSGW